ncbi:MAG: glycoside hydrolase, partial [Chitinophagaceae bacterium]|nr:glycoside hydrolase [Chitinophagaceae bacterium]
MRSRISLLILLVFCLCNASLFAQKSISVNSPDRSISVNLQNTTDGNLLYSLTYKGKPVIQPSTLGFSFSSPKALLNKFTITAVDSSAVDKSWSPVWGEVSVIRNNYKEVIVK